MGSSVLKANLLKTGLAACVLLLSSGAAMAQSAVTLTAAPATAALPDGQAVPMWGYSCTAFSGTDVSCTTASGAAAAAGVWQPPLIRVPAGPLTITLVNNLTFTAGAGTNAVATSLVIVGQLGGGLGEVSQRTTVGSPIHAPQGTTWPGTLGGTDTGAGDAVFTPPDQAPRVRSFATQVEGGATNSSLMWANLRPGTYLIESGTEPSIQAAMGLYGVLVVTDPLATPTVPQAYGTTFDSDVPLLLSEIDPVQNRAVDVAVRTDGFSLTESDGTLRVWNGQPGKCGDPAVHTCYPPAVNYDPLYYLINGVSFSRSAGAAGAVLPVSTAGAQTRVLLRFVNAGLRMHVPSVVGADMTLLAEDGNKLPGTGVRKQSSVLLTAGKTYDATIQPTQSAIAGTYANATYPVFDRALSLSTSNQRDGGMQAYINVGTGAAASTTALSAVSPTFTCVAGVPLVVTDPAKGVLASAVGANGVGAPTSYTGAVTANNLVLQSNGTFTYTPPASPAACAGTFTYLVNGTLSRTATINACSGACAGTAPTAGSTGLTSNIASRFTVAPPGVLAYVTNPSGYALTATPSSSTCGSGTTVNPDGSFVAIPATVPTTVATTCTFNYNVSTLTKQTSASDGVITVTFQPPSNLALNVRDAKNGVAISDYRWIIEEDKTFWIDPKCQINSTGTRLDSRGQPCAPLPVESLGYSFHTANMPVVAQGCVGAISCEQGQQVFDPDTNAHVDAACDIGNGVCRTGTGITKTAVLPGTVHLDPNKRYFISILPGDGVNTTIGGAGGAMQVNPSCNPDTTDCAMRPFDIALDCGAFNPSNPLWQPGNLGSDTVPSALCGHAMGGAQIAAGQNAVNVTLQQTPLPTAKIAVFVFQDDYPLNGENDAGGGVDVIAPNEPGLGGFELKVFDQAGGLGDATGQITYDQFNLPVSNALADTKDPITGGNACPISKRGDGLVGMIPTCPKFEDKNDPVTGLPIPSPLAGQAVIANLYPGLYEIVATPAADRIARGEEWLQTNTLDGAKAHEAFIKPNEPGYFQEFGPGGFHVAIGFANPKTIEDRRTNTAGTGLCDPAPNGGGQMCTATLNVQVTSTRMSRSPDQRVFSSGDYGAYAFTQCYVSVGPPDGADFAFGKCDSDGRVSLTNMPTGDFKLTVFDQWNDLMLDGLVSPVSIASGTNVKEFPVTQWRTNLYTRTFIDDNKDGLSDPDNERGLALVNTNIRYRDGSIGFFNNTDLDGYAGFNEVFPFMNWLVVETSSTRYKQTGIHTVYDVGGPADGSSPNGVPCVGSATTPCGDSAIGAGLANTYEKVSLPANQRVPGAVYCADADCTGASIATGAGNTAGTCTTNSTTGITTCTGLSSARIDPPQVWGPTMAWQGLLGQNSFINFGMTPFVPGENGGINGHVIYASTRPFDDPALSLQLSWEPGVPHVTINLYRKTVDANNVEHLTLVDHTTTTSWDDWAQGFHLAADGVTQVPNMNCPGQDPSSPFFQTLKDSKQWLDSANPKTALLNHSLFKCYDGWSQLNQVQPAPYDGMYKFPSVTGINPATGKPAGTNCNICGANPTGDGTQMLPAGKYVVEVIVPQGYELVKEEDKNILLGDVYIAPVSQQFAGFGNIFILPDQAAMNAAYNGNNPGNLNLTTNLGAKPRHEGDTGSVETFWACVGAKRIVPDLNSLYPGAGQAAPFAGASRNLCDRKEVTLEDQASVLAKFFIFSSTHIAGHFTGTITNDFASEFDPFSPQFGEKFGPPNLPVAMRDFTGNEVARVYSDQWGIYNGLYFSSYSVNPPNPTGYVPQMSIACMNDPGPIAGPGGTMITDPAYNPAYSNYCYETPFMPGFTAYMDTPVIPTQAFADGYNLPDSEYPDLTPAIGSVIGGSGVAGPWVSASGQTVTINCLGTVIDGVPCSKVVQNPHFSGPNASTPPYNQKTIVRHYGFGTTSGTVTIAGATATCGTWTNDHLVCTVPTISNTLNTTTGVGSTCYNGTSSTIPAGQTPPPRNANGSVNSTGLSAYRCGQLVVTRGDNSKRSIDAITVTVAGKPPTVVTPTTTVVPGPFGRTQPSPLQTAIDNAAPGDLIIVAPGTYRENLIMWKPVRLQGVGAGSVIINADAHPAGKMDSWRRQVACLFGLTIDGAPSTTNSLSGTPDPALYDPSGTYTCPANMFFRADRIPFEAFVGWDAAGNGNLAQILQEPTLMGAYEGAGITVTGRGVRIPTGSTDLWGQGTPGVPGAFPDGATYLRNSTTTNTANTGDCASVPTRTNGRDYGTGNFQCNPSRIDGMSIINSSQGGGGVFMHGWNHLLEIANNRIYGNHGTLSGAINLGNGETPPTFFNDGTICNAGITPAPLCPPFGGGTTGSLIGPFTVATNGAIPFQVNVKNHVHNNMVINNASLGDALFSGTPSGSGGITISAGSDAYTIDHNWIAANLSSGDGAGLAHHGLIFNGTIANNYILFNQSVNPTLPTNGGGLLFSGVSTDRTLPNGLECGAVVDLDCPPGTGDGAGQGNVINANLIMGNSAESGSGGGLRLQHVNGTEVSTFPILNAQWYGVTVTNNIIANNVAGWDGGGVSMQDALKVAFVNNTVVSNDTTASAGVLYKTLGAINSSSPPPGCVPTPDPMNPQNTLCLIPNAPHGPQPAGLVTSANTPDLIASLPAIVNCPVAYGYSGTLGINGDCRALSKPILTNNMFWQNRAFSVDIVAASTDPLLSQQNIIALTPALNQTATGGCAAGARYWDVGVRTDDLAAGTVATGTQVPMVNSIVTSTTGVAGSNNFVPGASPVVAQYCNGARMPPEHCTDAGIDQSNPTCKGFNAPPGRSETTGLTPVFVFNNITPAATVDEGHNWVNLVYGPLTLSRPNVSTATAPELMVATGTTATTGGAYSIGGTSAAVNRGTNSCTSGANTTSNLLCIASGGILMPAQTGTDFFGNPRAKSTANPADVGAVEYQIAANSTLVVATPSPLAFGDVVVGTTTTRDLTVSNNGTNSFTFTSGTGTVTGAGFSSVAGGSCNTTGTNGQRTLNAGQSCTIRVQLIVPGTTGAVTPGSVAIAGNQTVTGAPVSITANAVAATYSASVTSALAFGNWAMGTTSNQQNLVVTNTGNSAVTVGATGIAAPFARVTSGTFPTLAPNCGASVAPGESCSIKLQFAPTSAVASTQNVTVSTTPAGVVTPTPVVLSGTGVAARATVSMAPLTITLLTGTVTDDNAVILTNTAPVGTGASVTVSGVALTGGGLPPNNSNGSGLLTYFFNLVAGQDACTGQTLPPGGTCTVGVRFTNVTSPRGVNRTATIRFTDNGAGSAQSFTVNGFATP